MVLYQSTKISGVLNVRAYELLVMITADISVSAEAIQKITGASPAFMRPRMSRRTSTSESV